MIKIVLGALLVFVCGLVAAEIRRWLEHRSVRAALAAELSGLANLQGWRNFLDDFEAHISKLKESRVPMFFERGFRADYEVVYRANAARIGSLPGSLARRVVIAYSSFTALKEDLDLLAAAARNAPETQRLKDIEQCIKFHERTFEFAKRAFGLMDAAAKKLERLNYYGWPIRTRIDRVYEYLTKGLWSEPER